MLAERLGFESLWVGEHVVVPNEITSPYPHAQRPPFRADSRFLEPFAALAAMAACTREVRLGTGVLILPLRDPFVTARAIVTVDNLSAGRLELGVGTGWLEEEFTIVGRDFATRAARLEEMLMLFDELFRAARPQHEGREWHLPSSGFEPKPVQQPRPPIHLAGVSAAALRRAADLGDGWIGPRLDPPDAAALIDRLTERRGTRPRLTITVQGGADADLDAYERSGVDRLIVMPWKRSSRWREDLEAAAARFELQPRES
jgi:probable F420-dependent oxidoreductase